MTDKIAQAMLVRNGVNLYARIGKFMMVNKLTFGQSLPFVILLRDYASAQFGPITTDRSAYRGEYFYQVLRALDKACIIRLHRPSQYRSDRFFTTRQIAIEVQNLLHTEYGVNYESEWFEISNEFVSFQKAYETVFTTQAKLVEFVLRHDLSFAHGVKHHILDKMRQLKMLEPVE